VTVHGLILKHVVAMMVPAVLAVAVLQALNQVSLRLNHNQPLLPLNHVRIEEDVIVIVHGLIRKHVFVMMVHVVMAAAVLRYQTLNQVNLRRNRNQPLPPH
jgi:hypothetical protein